MGDNFEGKVEGGAALPTGMKGRAAVKLDEMLDMTKSFCKLTSFARLCSDLCLSALTCTSIPYPGQNEEGDQRNAAQHTTDYRANWRGFLPTGGVFSLRSRTRSRSRACICTGGRVSRTTPRRCRARIGRWQIGRSVRDVIQSKALAPPDIGDVSNECMFALGQRRDGVKERIGLIVRRVGLDDDA